MNYVDIIGSLVCGSAIWLLPIILPLFFCLNIHRKLLFYFIGLACSFLCYTVALFAWAFIAILLGYFIASIRHEDFQKGIEYGFAFALPGLKQGYMFTGVVPMLILGSLLSVIVLKKLKTLFKPEKSATT